MRKYNYDYCDEETVIPALLCYDLVHCGTVCLDDTRQNQAINIAHSQPMQDNYLVAATEFWFTSQGLKTANFYQTNTSHK